ncbi:MAG TPA: class II fructose-bisphosphatase [Patescibacteria group bacterium]
MDRNLALEFVRVTEVAAIAAAKWIGRGDRRAADQAAVDEMRSRFNDIDFSGRIVIGEGKKDEAPELYVGEVVGQRSGLEVDLAVDPLECTDSVANGRPNAISVIASAEKGAMRVGPDTYMKKIAVGPAAAGKVDLLAPVADNLKNIARALDKKVGELKIIALDRAYNEQIILAIRQAGARVELITDGDVAGAIAPSIPDSGIDALMGIGASSEGILAAAALKALGGDIQIQWNLFKHPELAKDLLEAGWSLDQVYSRDDLIKTDLVTFTATGICSGPILKGVSFGADTIKTHSVVMRGKTKTIRWIETEHQA